MDKYINYQKCFNSEEILEIMKQLNNAFKIMKENNIIHTNWKLENILIKYDVIDKKIIYNKISRFLL